MAVAVRPFIFIILLIQLLAPSWAYMRAPRDRCSRYPMDTRRFPQHGDNSFEIRITRGKSLRKIHLFDLGKTYQVVIKSRLPAVSFKNFYLTTEVEKMKMRNSMKPMKPDADGGRGRFTHIGNPPYSTFVPNCKNVVTATRQNMEMVKLTWTAPTVAQGCVRFLATVIKYRGVYFKDRGRLNVKICPNLFFARDEANNVQMLSDAEPQIRECCACGTATYKMEFQGKWIRQLHPRNWPEPDELVHWTSIIGASHNKDYSIYQIGKKADVGVREVCERGDTATLESDFKEGADHILNIIKTRGINGAKHMSETRTAIFSMNRTHHLMSMLTMLGPSPDWCAGISALDLCADRCEWVKERRINLYPWDAGVMKGNTYQVRPMREVDTMNIRQITKDWPAGNPFQEENGKLRPVATVTITRLSPQKNHMCPNRPLPGVTAVQSEQNDGEDPYTRPGKLRRPVDRVKKLSPNLQQMIPTMCFMTMWTKWSPCSVTCGTGSHTRTRRIVRNLKPALCIYVKLHDKRPCTGVMRTCDYSKPCSVTDWGSWSPCNATCNGRGHMARKRSFIRMKEVEVCSKTVKTEQMRNCTLQCDDTSICSAAVISGVQCFKPETRYYYDMSRKACLPFKYLGCKGSRNRFKTSAECHKTCDKAFDRMPIWQRQRLATKQRQASHKARLRRKGKTARSCKQKMDEGHKCRRRNDPHYRWYFDGKSKKCRRMVYKGCSGNENNFSTESDCKITCATLLARRRFTGPPQNCRVGSWGPWSPCSSKCSSGRRMRSRKLITAPLNGGRRCPRRFVYEKCKARGCKPCRYTHWSGWSPCTVTCGAGLQERTRELINKGNNCKAENPEFVDRVVCKKKACPKRKSFYFN